jgi:hypothetical protein
MHRVKIKIDITAPDRVLEPHGQTYVALEKYLEMPFVPFEGLYLQLNPEVSDDKRERHSQLFNSIDNVCGIFRVDNVYYAIDRDNKGEILAILEHAGEYTIEAFHALIEYLTEFYGFTAR